MLLFAVFLFSPSLGFLVLLRRGRTLRYHPDCCSSISSGPIHPMWPSGLRLLQNPKRMELRSFDISTKGLTVLQQSGWLHRTENPNNSGLNKIGNHLSRIIKTSKVGNSEQSSIHTMLTRSQAHCSFVLCYCRVRLLNSWSQHGCQSHHHHTHRPGKKEGRGLFCAHRLNVSPFYGDFVEAQSALCGNP